MLLSTPSNKAEIFVISDQARQISDSLGALFFMKEVTLGGNSK
jgi:hypothetical protein